MTPISPGPPDGATAATSAADSALADQAFDLLAVVQLADLRLVSLNRNGRRLLLCGPQDSMVDVPWAEFVTPATSRALQTHGVNAVRQGRSWRGSGFLRDRKGRDIPAQLFMTCHPGTRGCGLALIAALDDSRVYNLQTVLRNEQLLLQAVFETLADPIYFKDRESRFIRTNTAMARKMGVATPQDLVGRTDAGLFSAEHADQALADEKQIMATAEPLLDREEKETWPDGRITWVSASKYPLHDWRGEIVGTFGISRDITVRKLAEAERRRMEEELYLAQKMESIGRLAAGVAHEINTPMQFITDNTRFLVDAFAQLSGVVGRYRELRAFAAAHPDCHDAAQAAAASEREAELDYLLTEIPRTLAQTIDGTTRVARIVRSLTEYAHPSAATKEPGDLNRAIETAVAVSRFEWKLVADIVLELDPDLPLVPCVLDQFSQVMLNLIVNAAHAIADAVASRPDERGRITLRTRQEGAWALIEVEDTGTGIPEEIRRHVFEPFFTTKLAGRGTGQGLALVHTMIVKNHRGTIDFTSTIGRGTTFRLRLPLAPSSPPPPLSAPTATTPP